MKKALLALAGTATLFFAGALYVSWVGTAEETMNRPAFEGLDRTRLYKAYRSMHLDIATGKLDLGDFDEDDEADLARADALLIDRYNQQ